MLRTWDDTCRKVWHLKKCANNSIAFWWSDLLTGIMRLVAPRNRFIPSPQKGTKLLGTFSSFKMTIATKGDDLWIYTHTFVTLYMHRPIHTVSLVVYIYVLCIFSWCLNFHEYIAYNNYTDLCYGPLTTDMRQINTYLVGISFTTWAACRQYQWAMGL